MTTLRAILSLCRLALLPSVWSNCLAGWWLGGGGHTHLVPVILTGATLACLGASFLNDAFDAEYDQQHHPKRPIPAGHIAGQTVWAWALGWLAGAALVFLYVGKTAGTVGLVLIVLIILQNAVHRWFQAWPCLAGICRFLLYLLGSSIAVRGITGWAIWSGLALGVFVTGINWFRNWREHPEKAQSWPLLLTSTPVLLAFIINAGSYRLSACLLALVLTVWVTFSLRRADWFSRRKPVLAAAWLFPGIVLVDWLALANAPKELSLFFIALFLATLFLQQVQGEFSAASR